MNDELDTDARCATNVSLYTMEIEVLNALRLKHQELDQALEQQEMLLVEGNRRELAIDYTIEDPLSNTHFKKHKVTGAKINDYPKEQYRQDLTVKLKNAIMVVWLDVKKERNKPSIDQLIKDFKEKQKGEKQKDTLKRLRKEKREKQR